MKHETIHMNEFDETQRFLASVDENNILMVAFIKSFNKMTDEEGNTTGYELNISKISGIMEKTYDNMVKQLLACNYDTMEEFDLLRHPDLYPEEFAFHEQYVTDAQNFAKEILGPNAVRFRMR